VVPTPPTWQLKYGKNHRVALCRLIVIKVNVSDCRTRNEVEGEPACESHIEGKRESDPTRSRNAPAMNLDPLYSGGSPTHPSGLLLEAPWYLCEFTIFKRFQIGVFVSDPKEKQRSLLVMELRGK